MREERGRKRAAVLRKEGEREGPWGLKDKREVKWAPIDPTIVGRISIEI
jgi:hypothetical protein